MLSADMFGADEAVRIGLAEYSVPHDSFDEEIASLASRIADQSPFSQRAIKEMLDATDAMHLDAGLQREVTLSAGVGPDAKDRIAAFTNRKG